MCSQGVSKARIEQENERVKGKGGGRQNLKHIDGDVPRCMCKNDKDVQLKSKKDLKERKEKAEADIAIVILMVMYQYVLRMKVEEGRSQITRIMRRAAAKNVKCDGGQQKDGKNIESENKHTSRSSTETYPKRYRKNSWTMYIGAQETCPHGKRPQKCYGTIRGYNTKERSLTKSAHREEISNSRESTTSQDDEKRDPMNQSSSKSATPNLKESSMKPNLQPPHRCRKMTESLTMSKQAEGVVDAGVTSITWWKRRHKGCSYSGDAIWKTCCGR